MASQLISSERRFKSLWMKQEEPTDLSTVSADPTSLAKVDVNHEISFPQFIGSSLNLSVWKFKGHVLKLFFSSVPQLFWWIFFLVLAVVPALEPVNPCSTQLCCCNRNSQTLPAAVLLHMTDPSVIAALQPAPVSVLGRMVPMWVRFGFVRAVVSEAASAAFPFSKTLKINPPDTS